LDVQIFHKISDSFEQQFFLAILLTDGQRNLGENVIILANQHKTCRH